MNKQILPLFVLALGVTAAATAQVKEVPKKEKDQTITIRKKTDSKEKTTIVIDGDKVTVNGKPIEDLKDSDIEVLRNKSMVSVMPLLKERLRSNGGMKMFGDDNFAFSGGNRALLGVVSEKNDKGAKITSVTKESAADKAGLKKDDIITKVGDTKIENSEDLYEAIGDRKPEEKVTIIYLRDGKEATTTATLGKTANVKAFSFNGDGFNMDKLERLQEELPRMKERLREMPRMEGMDRLRVMPKIDGMEFYGSRRPRLGLEIQDVEEGKGVKILDVDSDTPASKAGLQKDDVISEVDGKGVATVDELKEKLKDLKEGDSIKITYKRAGQTKTADLKLPKKLKTADL
ncbi:MAG: PDZ domain-containing protein [Bacteroidota bacterium]